MKSLRTGALLVLVVSLLASAALAEEAGTIKLPPPETKGGMPLMDALMARRTAREYAPDPLPPQVLSNMLWAGFGINRPDKGLRTAPSARNKQEIDIYVVMKEGAYLWDAKTNVLTLAAAGDLREATGKQPFVKEAPVNLLYVADYSKMGDGPKEMMDMYAAADAAFISQNVYLYCASAGLATVVRAWVDKEALGAALKLGETKKVVFAQTVGYPKK